MDKTPFQLVSDMNTAFGNPKGDPWKINGPRLLKQCQNIASEFKELMSEFGYKDMKIEFGDRTAIGKDPLAIVDDIRDALCDIMVFSLGAYHFMGFDADVDMHEVVSAVMTRLCDSDHHAVETRQHYENLGVLTYAEETPFGIAIKSAEDQQMPEFPKGKFLKALGYRKPKFSWPSKFEPVPFEPEKYLKNPVIEDMKHERERRAAHDEHMRKIIRQQVAEFQAKLEQEFCGLPPYDGNMNQDTMPGGVQEQDLRKLHDGV